MKRYGVFDIIGPIMVGPSSSHTAGAARLGKMARYLCGGEIREVKFLLHGSFAQTYKGHGTDKALLAGILDIDSADYKLRESFEIANKRGLIYSFIPTDLGDVHPNTVCFVITTKDGRQVSVTGSSIGGGNVIITNINGISVNFTGESPILVTKHQDKPGVVSKITALLYEHQINIGNMRVNRIEDATLATMYIELDGAVTDQVMAQMKAIPGIESAILLDARLGESMGKDYV
jgi:L-serine dehydratase